MMRSNYRRAQSLVEFALALPLIAVLLLGLVEFGFLLYGHIQVANATREGARAASLYQSARLQYSPSNCWTMRAWVENALVERNRTSTGCPSGTFNPAIHAFGTLNPSQCSADPTGTPGPDCWWLAQLTSNNTAITDTPTAIAGLEGKPIEVRVRYRYTMAFARNFLPFIDDPMVIEKVVIMRLQNN